MFKDNNKVYKSALLVIGNEILSGRTKDENINYLAKNLSEIGVRLSEVRVISDIESEIVGAVNELRKKYDYLFTTGGIGPTHDDITVESIAKAFGVKNVLNKEAYNLLLEYYGSDEKINSSRKRMAYMPEGSTIINNSISKAPGIKMKNVYILAGVPSIMQNMFEEVKRYLISGEPIKSIEINCPIPEGEIAEKLKHLQEDYCDVEIGSYPYFSGGIIGTMVVIRSVNQTLLKEVSKKTSNLIESFVEK
ncbi:molybdopterin-binding protein [Alphaproteobacteria bacterium]|nr:molybdopterin-binding protein [Alphaproteobacteria bacterium]